MSRANKKAVRQIKENVVRTGKKVARMERVVLGFNYLTEKKAIVIALPSVNLYRELMGQNDKEIEVWMKNTYLYCRLKMGMAPGAILFFKDIETEDVIGSYNGKNAEIV
jgi:hypothetical protein